jgi:iron complex transport system ATP-binding protein
MLRVEGLSVSYAGRPVLQGIDLEVGPRQVVGLIGPNGSGKSTLIKAVTRVVPWDAGRVFVGETDVATLSARALARCVAVVSQSPQLPAGYTVAEVVLMGRTAHLGFLSQEGAEDQRVAAQALAQVGASHLAGRPVDELSGGERQNVVLARALAQQAPVLLLDEPTANLDIGHQVAFAGLVRSLAADGLAVLAAIHDLTLASLYCDRLALLAGGRFFAEGRPADVLTRQNLRRAYGADVKVVSGLLERPLVLPVGEDGTD